MRYTWLTFCMLLILPLGLSAQSYDLESYLQLVDANSKDLKMARKNREEADAVKKEAWATALPKLFAEGDYRRNLLENYLYVDFPDGSGGTSKQKFKISRNNEYSFNAVLSQTLFSFKIGNALKAADQYEQLSDFLYEASRQQILTMAKKLFYQGLLLRKVWDVAHSSEANARENYENMKNKFENGQISEFELLQAEVRWKNKLPQTSEAGKNYKVLLSTLKNMAGIDGEQEIQLLGVLDAYPEKPGTGDTQNILQQRPDFQAMLWETHLRKTGLSAANSEYYPYLDGNLIYAFSSQSDIWRFENRNNNFILGVQLSIPIYTGGYTGAQVQKARIDFERSQLRLEKARLDIRTELQSIRLRLDEAEQRIQSASSTLETAEKAFRIAEVSAENGLITQLELKDSRVYFDQATLNYSVAVYDYMDACFDWDLATGNL